MPTIDSLTAYEILDSRGRPTLYTVCRLRSGVSGAASIPSGASTGTAEAHELRDGDPKRYRGLGCRRAVAGINGEINAAVSERPFETHAELDRALIALDGTPDKSRLGANAILAASMAFARAAAAEMSIPLYRYFARLVTHDGDLALPRPMINLFSGGKHAGGQVTIQDVQVMPTAAHSIDDLLAVTFDVFYAAAGLVKRRYGMRLLTADEGGLAPDFPSAEAMLDAAVESIRAAGYEPGRDVALTVDVAASHFYDNGLYTLDGARIDTGAMIERLLAWLRDYPVASVEDGLAEDDWAGWTEFRRRAPHNVLVLGDDLLCTNPARIRRAIDSQAANALLLKVNQIGTLTEAAEARDLARAAGWRVVVGARSGETEDDWLADLAVGWRGDHLKVGSITQSERLAKYNRLLIIEAISGLKLA